MVIDMDYGENAKIRKVILKILYEVEIKDPDPNTDVTRPKMLERLKVDEKLMDFNIYYLNDKKLIFVRTTPNSPWLTAKITHLGIDKVEYQPPPSKILRR